MRKIYFVVLNILFVASIHAQLMPFNDHYIDNSTIFNPAAFDLSAIDYQLDFGLTYRRQWENLPFGPKSFFLRGANTVISDYGNSFSFGGYLMNDQAGAIGLTSVNGKGSYIIDFATAGNSYLAIGLTLGLLQYRVKAATLFHNTPIDPGNIRNLSSWHFDGGLGVFYQSNFFHIGLSSPQLFVTDTKFKLGNSDEYFTNRIRHYYFQLGFDFESDSYFVIKPEIWIKFADKESVFSTNVLIEYDERFYGGIGISIQKDYDSTIQFSPNLAIGYTIIKNNHKIKIGGSIGVTSAVYNQAFGPVSEFNLVYYLD